MKKLLPLILLLPFLLVSCNLPITITIGNPATATSELPAATQAVLPTETALPAEPLATATPEIQGTALNLGGVSMIVPACLATTASGVIMPESDPGNDGPVFMANPEYRKITLQGYPLSDKFWEPMVQVYPVQRYVELAPNLADTVSEMQQILANKPASFDQSIPLLPIENAAQIFRAQVAYTSFQNGQGIGFLTEYAQYYAPVNNHDLFYTFQGLTNDGKYWVSAIFPVNAAYLQPTYNDFTVPADGIAAPQDMSSASFSTDMEAYYVQMLAKLNATSPDAFNPTLTCIQQYIQTLNIAD